MVFLVYLNWYEKKKRKKQQSHLKLFKVKSENLIKTKKNKNSKN